MKQSYDITYKSLKNLVAEMKSVGKDGFDVHEAFPTGIFGNEDDRDTQNVTGTKIIIPPPFRPITVDTSRWYNGGQTFALQLNGEGVDEPEEPWIDIVPVAGVYVDIGPMIFHKITVRNNDEVQKLEYPVKFWIVQDPQFINQVNEMLRPSS